MLLKHELLMVPLNAFQRVGKPILAVNDDLG